VIENFFVERKNMPVTLESMGIYNTLTRVGLRLTVMLNLTVNITVPGKDNMVMEVSLLLRTETLT
jgi:hypothetical protein